MAFALVGTPVQASSSDSGATVTTGTYDTSGANFVAVIVSHHTGRTFTVTDNKSNGNATQAINRDGPDSASIAIYYWTNPTTGSGHTFTVTSDSSSVFPGVGVLAFSGAATSAVLDTGQTNSSASSSNVTSRATGSVTPSADGYLIITGLGTDSPGASSISQDNSVTTQGSTLFVASNAYGMAYGYKIQGTAAAIDVTYSWTSSVISAAAIAVFKVASGGGGSGNPWYYYAQQ